MRSSLTKLQTYMKYLFYVIMMTSLAAFLVNGYAVDDAVLLENRKCHPICSILVSTCSACSS